jgi:hypothetical protein
MRESSCTRREAPEQDEPCTWLWDEISPRATMAEKTVERLRKPEDGPREWEFSHAGTLVLAPWSESSTA